MCVADVVTDLSIAKVQSIKKNYAIVLTVSDGVTRVRTNNFVEGSKALNHKQKHIYKRTTNCLCSDVDIPSHVLMTSPSTFKHNSNLNLNANANVFDIICWCRPTLQVEKPLQGHSEVAIHELGCVRFPATTSRTKRVVPAPFRVYEHVSRGKQGRCSPVSCRGCEP